MHGRRMPFGLFGGSPIKFPKRKTYSLHHEPTETASGFVFRNGGHSRQNGTPTGILKKGGRRPKSFPTLSDGMVPQEMAAAIPMPPEHELNAKFTRMVVRKLHA